MISGLAILIGNAKFISDGSQHRQLWGPECGARKTRFYKDGLCFQGCLMLQCKIRIWHRAQCLPKKWCFGLEVQPKLMR